MPNFIKNMSSLSSPKLSPIEVNLIPDPEYSGVVESMGKVCLADDLSSKPPVSLENPRETLETRLRAPEPSPGASSTDVSPGRLSAELKAALDRAFNLLNMEQATEAMYSLASVEEYFSAGVQTRDTYSYYSLYGWALMGHIKTLNTQNSIGEVTLTATVADGLVKISQLTAERLGCYVGICGISGKLIELLSNPDVRQQLSETCSEEKLAESEGEGEYAQYWSILKIQDFMDRLVRCNIFKANLLLASQRDETLSRSLPDNDRGVPFLRNVTFDSWYTQLTEVGHSVNTMLCENNQTPEYRWMNWYGDERRRYLSLPEVAAALARPGIAALLGASF